MDRDSDATTNLIAAILLVAAILLAAIWADSRPAAVVVPSQQHAKE